MQQHIPGRKSLTDHIDVKHLMPKKNVYIPVFTGRDNNCDILVKEGDHVDIGTKLYITKTGFEVPVYSSVSGTYTGTIKKPHNSMRPQPHMVIELSEEQNKIQAFPPMDWEKATQPQMVEFVKNAGIIGQGGAGFPTYVKYMNPANIDTLVINAVECEPYITADYKVVMDNVQDLIHGVRILQKMAGASKVYVAIKKSHPDIIQYVMREIEKEGAGAEISVYPVPDVYPMGGERTLLRTILKKEYDKLPSEIGCIVNNAFTAILVARAFEKGEAEDQKYVTFSGEALNYPVNVMVPVGMQVSEILEQIGGIDSKLDSCKIIAGGPMMGKAMVSDQFVIDRAMNAVTVLPNKDYPAMTCMKCGRCSAHCPIGLQPVRIAEAVKVNNVEEMEKRGALQCIECGLCTYVCPSHIQVTENVRKAKRTINMKKKK